jgi:hypothetical protein
MALRLSPIRNTLPAGGTASRTRLRRRYEARGIGETRLIGST